MRIIFTVLLHVLHFCYSVILRIQYLWRQRSLQEPQPLQTARQRIPHHLAILFVVNANLDKENTKSALIENILRVVEWCQMIKVKKVTLYEENGLLLDCIDDIRSALPIQSTDCSESEEDYQPPTPPLSDYADSLPVPTGHAHNFFSSMSTLLVSERLSGKDKAWARKRRTSHSVLSPTPPKNDLLLCLISRSSSKPAIASAAQALAAKQTPRLRRNSRSQKVSDFELTVEQLNRVLEDERGLSSPDFIIIHQLSSLCRVTPPELHGFPPWHIRLSELFPNPNVDFRHIRYSSPNSSILDERTFRRALDEFASAEMRFGK